MRIALDAMGGDFAPAEPVKGALLGAQANPDVEILLVGRRDAIQENLGQAAKTPANIRICEAADVIGMDEHPAIALKKKPDSSIARMFGLVVAGEADAAVSAGNTGAMVAGAAFFLKFIEGVKRPGIAINMPAGRGHCTVIDCGANVECKPIHLLQYAVMASEYNRLIVGNDNPRVGLLSVGSEEAKGNKLVKDTLPLMKELGLQFIGNVEGGDAYNGRCDVMVCDGFVGNVLLKVTEGVAESMMARLKSGVEKDTWTRLGMKLVKPAIDDMVAHLDYAEYGGAPLLGVQGVTIICHGRSDANAIKNALKAAIKSVQQNVTQKMAAALTASRQVWDRASGDLQ
jgi:phosphate acyltransferase